MRKFLPVIPKLSRRIPHGGKGSFAALRMTVLFLITACDLAPDFKTPDISLPAAYKEQLADTSAAAMEGTWRIAQPLAKEERGQWWKIFGDEQLNTLVSQAAGASPTLQAAVARVTESRANAGTSYPSLLPDISIGGNAVRAKYANTYGVAFGQSGAQQLKPFTIFTADGVANYELDLFGQVRNNYKALLRDADAAQAAYQSALLALQADVAQSYFQLRAYDSERRLLRDAIAVRTEAARIMQSQFNAGFTGSADLTRTQSELAGSRADLIAVERQRAVSEHALAILLGKLPSEFTLAEIPLSDSPPAIPADLPSNLLTRRPDISAAVNAMAAANARIGVARAAFFPSINLSVSGGFQATDLNGLFHWSGRSWALGQTAGDAITMPIFDNGRNLARLELANAAYDEAVANYRQAVLVAFRDVEDNLTGQRLLAAQSEQQDKAADASTQTTHVTRERYDAGDITFFEVVNAEQNSLAASRIAVQLRGQRFLTTVALIRALGGGWAEEQTAPAVPEVGTPNEELPVPLLPIPETAKP